MWIRDGKQMKKLALKELKDSRILEVIGAPSRLADYDIDDSQMNLWLIRAMEKVELLDVFKHLNGE